jgi:proteasome lid subunit RPN8/RPN11
MTEKKESQEDSEQRENEPLNNSKNGKIIKPVIIKAEAYKTIILYASRYANQAIPPKNWKEIYGILIGYSDDDYVYVERAEALTYGHSTDVQLDAKHYVFIDAIQQKLDEEGNEYYMVGWFHSHPGLNLFFSYIDLLNQLGFQQNNDDFCGLVFDHTLLGKKKYEIVKGEDGEKHTITKYETGFEIYRLIDVNMEINNKNYDKNYYKVDYFIEGLNKFFFANILIELSALATERKPLQSAYGENDEIETFHDEENNIKKKKKKWEKSEDKSKTSINKDALNEIPTNTDIHFNFDDLFYDNNFKKKNQEIYNLKEEADKSIYEGNQYFKSKDAFMGIEKYRQGIEDYKKLNDNNRVLELLRSLSDLCIQSGHFVFAKECIEELYDLSKKYNSLFYSAEANYLSGYVLLKEGNNEFLETALKKVQQSSIDYEKIEDFAGAGKSYHQIGLIYQSRLNKPYNACLFYNQAIKCYNEAILKAYVLRKSAWAKPESLTQKILELKDIVEELIPKIDNIEEKQKILNDLNSLKFNF